MYLYYIICYIYVCVCETTYYATTVSRYWSNWSRSGLTKTTGFFNLSQSPAEANQRHQCPMALGLCLLRAEIQDLETQTHPKNPTRHPSYRKLEIRIFYEFLIPNDFSVLGDIAELVFYSKMPTKMHTSFWGWNVQASPVGDQANGIGNFPQMLLISLALGAVVGLEIFFTVGELLGRS